MNAANLRGLRAGLANDHRPRPEGRDLRRGPASGRRGFQGRALAGVVTQDNHLIGDGGRPIGDLRPQSRIPFDAVLAPGKPAPQAPHLHIDNVNAYHGRLKQWLNRFNGVATRSCRTISDGAALSKPGATNSNRQTGSKARSERTIPTANAIRADIFFTISRIHASFHKSLKPGHAPREPPGRDA